MIRSIWNLIKLLTIIYTFIIAFTGWLYLLRDSLYWIQKLFKKFNSDPT